MAKGSTQTEVTLVWGLDPTEDCYVFVLESTANLLAATASAVNTAETIRELEALLPAGKRDWVLEQYQEWYEDEQQVAEEGEDLPSFEDWEYSDRNDSWYADEFQPWPYLTGEEITAELWKWFPDEVVSLIDDEGWEHTTDSGDFLRIEDGDEVARLCTAAGLRVVRDDALIDAMTGP